MDILLNGQPLDFEIEDETTLGDIIDSISKWLYERGAVIVSARMDGAEFDLSREESLRSHPITDIQKLEFDCQNAGALVVETIDELGQYLDRVARLAPQMKDEDLKGDSIPQLVEGLGWCIDVMRRVEQLLQIDYSTVVFENEKFHKKILRLGDIRDHIKEAQANSNTDALRAVLNDSVAPLCDSIVRALPMIIEKGNLQNAEDGEASAEADVAEELEKIRGVLSSMPETLENIAVKISLGDTADGMERFAAVVNDLERAFGVLERVRREIPLSEDVFVVDSKSFEERSEEISNVLSELIAAFERKDRVLIGDLIEYEIAPETEALSQIIEQIRKTVKGACH